MTRDTLSHLGPADIASLRHRLAEAEDNLRLIKERKSQYVMGVDVPLQLVKQERVLQNEIAALKARLTGAGAEPTEQSSAAWVSAMLERLDALLAGQEGLRQGQATIYAHIGEADRAALDVVLEAVQQGRMEQGEMRRTLEAVRRALIALQGRKLPALQVDLRWAVDELPSVISSDLTLKNKLELTLPIIPLLLHYKVELEAAAGLDLRQIWDNLRRKAHRRQAAVPASTPRRERISPGVTLPKHLREFGFSGNCRGELMFYAKYGKPSLSLHYMWRWFSAAPRKTTGIPKEPEFVNRDRQIQTFTAMLHGACENRILVLMGDSGLGKSWLIDRLAYECDVRGVQWCSTAFDEETGGPSYVDILWSAYKHISSSHFGEFEQALDKYRSPTYRLELSMSESMPTVVIGAQSEWREPVFGDIAGISIRNPQFYSASSSLGTLIAQEELTDYFSRGLAEVCSKGPFVWFLDNCDRAPSLTRFWLWEILLASLTHHVQNSIVVMTGRSFEDLDRRWRCVAEVQALEPFGMAEIRSYLLVRGISQASEDLAIWSLAATSGNPRAIGKLVDAYLDLSRSRKRK